MSRALITTVFTVILVMGTAFGILYRFWHVPLSHQTQSTVYLLSKGTSVKSMIRQMEHAQILSPMQGFLLACWIRWEGAERQLKAGEYAIPLNITPEKLIQKLKKGEVVQHAITFSEGITFKDAVKLLQSHPAVNADPDLNGIMIMTALGEPQLSPEGLFFPSTYFFTRGTTSVGVLKVARKTMENRLQKAYNERSYRCVLKSPYEVLIMASIIEKESALPNERPIISGVFQGRLTKGMLLQADPTLMYGLFEQNPGKLTYDLLKKDFPYNTYKHKGLPPTPIALPSLNAIMAACHPDDSAFLYFVAKGDGSHYFSETLKEHDAAVKKYQKKSDIIQTEKNKHPTDVSLYRRKGGKAQVCAR